MRYIQKKMVFDVGSFGFVIVEWILGVFILFCLWTFRQYCRQKAPGQRTVLDGMYQHVFEYSMGGLSVLMLKGSLFAIYFHYIPEQIEEALDRLLFGLYVAQALEMTFSTYVKLTFVFNYKNPFKFNDEDILKFIRGLTTILTLGTIGVMTWYEIKRKNEYEMELVAIVLSVLTISSQIISRTIIYLKFGHVQKSNEIISTKTIAVLLGMDTVAFCISQGLGIVRFDQLLALHLAFLLPVVYQIVFGSSNLRNFIKRKYLFFVIPIKQQNSVSLLEI